MRLKLREAVTDKILRLFGFLVDEFGCRVISERRDGQPEQVTFANQTTFVRVAVERKLEVLVHFGPFRNNTIPPYGAGWYDLNSLLIARNEPVPQCVARGFRPGELDRCLAEHAEALRRVGGDVLQGDFSVLPLLDETIRDRLRAQHEPGEGR